MQIWGEKADKVAREFTTSLAWAYTLETSKVTLLDRNSDLPGCITC